MNDDKSMEDAQGLEGNRYTYWGFMFCWLNLDIFIGRETNLMHSLSSLYFVKHLYMFRVYL